jgi:hypothetical protein
VVKAERKVKKKWKCTDSVEMEVVDHGSLLPEGEGSDTRLQELVYDRVQLRRVETVAALNDADGQLKRPVLLVSGTENSQVVPTHNIGSSQLLRRH